MHVDGLRHDGLRQVAAHLTWPRHGGHRDHDVSITVNPEAVRGGMPENALQGRCDDIFNTSHIQVSCEQASYLRDGAMMT